MAVYRLVLVSVLLLGLVCGCGKDDKDSVSDWAKPSKRRTFPKAGHVLVDPSEKDLDPWSHWKKGQHAPGRESSGVLMNNEAMREWTKKGRHTPVPEPGHVLVK